MHIDDQGTRTELVSRERPAKPSPVANREHELVLKLVDGRGGEVVVDVDDVSRILAVTSRTGQRVLTSLVEAGLAWPLPSQPSGGGGRPRKRYRILVERLASP
jgi:hypothetical protein